MKNSYRKIGIGLFILTGMLLYLLNYYTPLYADDYNYLYSFATGERISSIRDIVPSMKAHYHMMNGRILLHALDQFFLMIGKQKFNVINTGAFLLLLLLVGYHSGGSWKKLRWESIGISFFLIWWCTPEFGQSFLWVTGASNYLYGILMILLFLIPYRRYLEFRKGSQAVHSLSSEGHMVMDYALACFRAFCMALFGIMAGWTNENTGVAMIVMVVLFLYAYRREQLPWKPWMFAGLTGNAIGFYLMLSAPAQQGRLEAAGGLGSLKDYVVRGIHITMDIWENMTVMALVCVVLYALMVRNSGEQVGEHKKLEVWAQAGKVLDENKCLFIYGVGLLASLYSMIAVPVFVGRVWSGPIVLGCIVLGIGYEKNADSVWESGKAWKMLLMVMGISFLCTYGEALIYVRRTYVANQERLYEVQQQKQAGMTELELPVIYGYTKFTCYSDKVSDGDLSLYEDYWGNVILARYFEVEKIRMKQ